MTDTLEPSEAIEIQRLQIEDQKSKRNFWSTLIVSGAAVVIAGAITATASIYAAYISQDGSQKLELIKIDADLVKSFSSEFLSEDIGERIKAAHLFKSIAPSDDIRTRWTKYHAELTSFRDAIVAEGRSPNGDIRSLFEDEDFLKNFGGMGCSYDDFSNCVADMPETAPNNIYDLFENSEGAVNG